jgi:hypothetical protein
LAVSFRDSKVLCLAIVAVIAATVAATPASASGRAFAFAPYVDTSLYPPLNLKTTARATGVRYFSLAFVLSGGGCKASWGGVTALADERAIAPQLKSLRALRGDALASFGGANGTELALACPSAESLAAQYQAVITKYKLQRIDFDIEGGAVGDSSANIRRGKAIAMLQRSARAAGRKLAVSFTLPALPTGLTAEGIALLRATINAGAKISIVNAMAMDYGDAAAPNPKGRMGYYAIKLAGSLKGQLHRLYPKLSTAKLWGMVGVTPMIGVNDSPSEIFMPADASQLVKFASSKHLGMLALWSAGRDKQCPGGAKAWAQATCSSVAQSPFEFSKLFKRFTG